ncbi:MAG TPA: hypothetical protein VMN78_13240 [Longimicrobiales bacterium]|nr:hypothetical protein [Longimicrobiales bacterium]
MRHREFEELAFAHWHRIPEEYKQGVDGVRVLRRSKAHDELPDVYTLGECVTEAYPSDYGGPDTTRSAVVLYWGSFAALAELDADFDWEDELWETLTHELRHHLESLAAEDALEDVDYAADENFKRYEGEPFDPFFHRSGEPAPAEERPRVVIGPASSVPAAARPMLPAWRVETDWFFELEWSAARPPSGPVVLEWLGARHAFELPEPEAAVTFVALTGGFTAAAPSGRRVDDVTLVLVRRTSAWRAMLDALRGRTLAVAEIEVDVTTSFSDGQAE